MLEKITHKSFESIVGETVDLKAGDVSFRADVESVNLLRQNPGQGRQSFSVELQAHDATNHGQQMYQLSHPNLGDLSLFLVPVGPGESGMCYEIVFN
jgi:hypothetical protein